MNTTHPTDSIFLFHLPNLTYVCVPFLLYALPVQQMDCMTYKGQYPDLSCFIHICHIDSFKGIWSLRIVLPAPFTSALIKIPSFDLYKPR